jgi:3D (Asp-Asp-Asp) domain-containing protein
MNNKIENILILTVIITLITTMSIISYRYNNIENTLDEVIEKLENLSSINNNNDFGYPVSGFSYEIAKYSKKDENINNSAEVEIEKTDDIIVKESPKYLKVSSTAYWNKYNRKCADGTTPEYGTLAGKVEWIGKSVKLYRVNDDGDVGELIGTFTFHDTGYGQSTGYGTSKLLKGKNLGTIEVGQCIDIFMSKETDCIKYGVKDVYMEFVE